MQCFRAKRSRSRGQKVSNSVQYLNFGHKLCCHGSASWMSAILFYCVWHWSHLCCFLQTQLFNGQNSSSTTRVSQDQNGKRIFLDFNVAGNDRAGDAAHQNYNTCNARLRSPPPEYQLMHAGCPSCCANNRVKHRRHICAAFTCNIIIVISFLVSVPRVWFRQN